MIVVKVELWPASRPGTMKTLAVMRLCNDGTGSKTRRNYDVELLNVKRQAWKSGRVEGHPSEAVSVWRLVVKGIQACLPAPKTKADERQGGLKL